jgi:uncharacterized protein (DUF1330 family)
MAVEPNQEQLAELAARAGGPDDGPVVMLNLNRYRDRDAYARYGEVAARVLERLGGRILWYSQAQGTVIGEQGDDYDEVLAVWYPSLAAFIALATDEEIVPALEHRRAGLERATLICCEPGSNAVLDGP